MARQLTREERINYEWLDNIKKYGPNDFKSTKPYCEAYVDGMIAAEQAQIHPTTAGYGILAAIDAAAINSLNGFPHEIQIMGYSLDKICQLINKYEERKVKAIVIDHVDKSPVIIKRNGTVILDETE